MSPPHGQMLRHGRALLPWAPLRPHLPQARLLLTALWRLPLPPALLLLLERGVLVQYSNNERHHACSTHATLECCWLIDAGCRLLSWSPAVAGSHGTPFWCRLARNCCLQTLPAVLCSAPLLSTLP